MNLKELAKKIPSKTSDEVKYSDILRFVDDMKVKGYSVSEARDKLIEAGIEIKASKETFKAYISRLRRSNKGNDK